jgi:ketosteroid isomerase-like protein
MSHADVELVRRVFDAYLGGDEEATFELLAPDVVVTQFPDQVDGRDYHGHDGVREVMAEWIGSWDDWSIELLEAWEVGELVFVRAFQQGRGQESGAPMATEVVFVFTVRDGLIARWQMFGSERDAREATGHQTPATE